MCNYTGISATVYGSQEYGLRSACIRAVKEPNSQKGVRGRFKKRITVTEGDEGQRLSV